jgi:hypothetical protein
MQDFLSIKTKAWSDGNLSIDNLRQLYWFLSQKVKQKVKNKCNIGTFLSQALPD